MFSNNEIRMRLADYMIDHPVSFQSLALKIHVNPQTLKNFALGLKTTNSKTLARIEYFLRNEKDKE